MFKAPIRKRFAGLVDIDVGFLLKIFDLEGGEILDVRFEDDFLPHKVIRMIIEHPDLPQVDKDKPLDHVYLTHQTTCGENGVPIKIERIEPPKKHRTSKG